MRQRAGATLDERNEKRYETGTAWENGGSARKKMHEKSASE
jgi:hypothetical protein